MQNYGRYEKGNGSSSGIKKCKRNRRKIDKKGKMTLEEIAECVPLLSINELREYEDILRS